MEGNKNTLFKPDLAPENFKYTYINSFLRQKRRQTEVHLILLLPYFTATIED
jgi:hypothetical protein